MQHFPTCSACACIFEDMREMADLPEAELQDETKKERFGLFAQPTPEEENGRGVDKSTPPDLEAVDRPAGADRRRGGEVQCTESVGPGMDAV